MRILPCAVLMATSMALLPGCSGTSRPSFVDQGARGDRSKAPDREARYREAMRVYGEFGWLPRKYPGYRPEMREVLRYFLHQSNDRRVPDPAIIDRIMASRPLVGLLRKAVSGRDLSGLKAICQEAGCSSGEDQLPVHLINAVLLAGDPHARFLSVEDQASLASRVSGVGEGAGVSLANKDGAVEISSVQDGSPGKGAVSAGERVVAVKGQDGGWRSPDLDEDGVRLKKPGKAMQVKVSSAGKVREVALDRTLWKDAAMRPSVSVAGGVPILKIPIFYEGGQDPERLAVSPSAVDHDLAPMVSDLVATRSEWVAVDLRGNPGGVWATSLRAAGLFLPGRPFGSLDFGDRPADVYLTPGSSSSPSPLSGRRVMVLVDESTASGGEVFAAFLQQAGACVVGPRTFGKGTFQSRSNVIWSGVSDVLGQVVVTSALVRLADGEDLQLRGVIPDVRLVARPGVESERDFTNAIMPPSGPVPVPDARLHARPSTDQGLVALAKKECPASSFP